MKKQVKFIFWGSVLVLIVLYGISNSLRPLDVEVFAATPREIVKTFTESGVVSPAASTDIYTATGGRILTLSAREGDAVTGGDLLLTFDTREIRQQITQLQGQLASVRGQEQQAFAVPPSAQVNAQKLAVEQAQLQVDTAKAEQERMAALYQAGAVSSRDYQSVKEAVTQTELLLAQQQQSLRLLQEEAAPPAGTRQQFSGIRTSLQAQIDLLRYQQSLAAVEVPISGIIGQLMVQEGAVVPPGSLLATVFDPGRFEVHVYVLAADIPGLREDAAVDVRFETAAGELAYTGKIASIAPAAVERVSALGLTERRVKVVVALAGDTSALRPGYSVDVIFTVEREPDRLVVPKTALFPYNGGDALWVVRNGKAYIQPVKKGLEAGDEVVVIEGLQEGDRIIRNPRLAGLKNEGKVSANE